MNITWILVRNFLCNKLVYFFNFLLIFSTSFLSIVDADILFFPRLVASYSAVNEIRGEAAESVGSAKTTNNATTSLKQQKLEAHPQNDNILMNASNVAFKSLPTMHINEQASPEDVQILQNRNPQSSEPGGRILSKSCPEPISCVESSESFMNKDFSTHQMESCAQKKYFASHWSLNAVNDAIEVSLTQVL